MLFKDIIGQESLQKVIVNAFQRQHLAHALIFNGQEGCANLALALATARYIHCENKQEDDACGKCNACLKHNKLIHPDFHFIFPVANTDKVPSGKSPDCKLFLPEWREIIKKSPYFDLHDWLSSIKAGSKQGNIPVEEIRTFISNISFKPFESKYKVVLLWLPEIMNASSSNAFLKILEEPTPNTHFLLVCNNPKKLLPTILSRVQPIQVPPFTEEEIAFYLQNNKNVAPENAKNFAFLSDNNLVNAIKIVDNQDFDDFTWFRDWMRECYKPDFPKLLLRTEEFGKFSKETQKYWLEFGLEVFRQCLLLNYAGEERLKVTKLKRDFLQGFAKSLSNVTKIEKIMQLFEKSIYHIEGNANGKILFFQISIQCNHILKS